MNHTQASNDGKVIAAEGYQRIELPGGVTTSGTHDRSTTSLRIFPADMRGASLLDVGCMEGFFCFEAAKRGAAAVVGLDVNPDYLRSARELNHRLGYDVTFQEHDIDQSEFAGAFDYVICLNVLHHMQDPLQVLQRLVTLTRDRLVLEVAGLGPHEAKKAGLSRLQRLSLRNLPVMFVNKSARLGKRQKYYFAPEAIRTILQEHYLCFAKVEIVPSDFKDRYIAIGYKRRIKHLVIVAGPTAAGQRQIAEQLATGQGPLTIASEERPLVTPYEELLANPHPALGDVVLHYDFLERYKWNLSKHVRQELDELLACAQRCSIVTVRCSDTELLTRLEATQGIKDDHRAMLERCYRDPRRLGEYYSQWDQYVAGLTADSCDVPAPGSGTP